MIRARAYLAIYTPILGRFRATRVKIICGVMSPIQIVLYRPYAYAPRKQLGESLLKVIHRAYKPIVLCFIYKFNLINLRLCTLHGPLKRLIYMLQQFQHSIPNLSKCRVITPSLRWTWPMAWVRR